MRAVNDLKCMLVLALTNCLYERTILVYHPFFTHCRSGIMFSLRPSSPLFEPYCLFLCLLICLFVCVYHKSDITTCTTSGLQILVTLCNDVRNGFSYTFMSTSKLYYKIY